MRSATKKKLGKDADYLADLHNFPCAICFLVWYRANTSPSNWGHWVRNYLATYGDSAMAKIIGQKQPTEAAHVGDAFASQKCPDIEAIPLCCPGHHREAKGSEHDGSKDFFYRFGVNREELINALQERYETNREAA